MVLKERKKIRWWIMAIVHNSFCVLWKWRMSSWFFMNQKIYLIFERINYLNFSVIWEVISFKPTQLLFSSLYYSSLNNLCPQTFGFPPFLQTTSIASLQQSILSNYLHYKPSSSMTFWIPSFLCIQFRGTSFFLMSICLHRSLCTWFLSWLQCILLLARL